MSADEGRERDELQGRPSHSPIPDPPPVPLVPLGWLRGAWDVIVGVTGLCGVVLLLLAPAFGLDELRSPEAWATFAGAAGILPVKRAAEAVVRGGRSS